MGTAVTLYDFNGVEIETDNPLPVVLYGDNGDEVGLKDVQYPLATDGDSIYVKDLNLSVSDNGNFSGGVDDLFNSLTTVNLDSTTNNPKVIKVWFNRSIQTSAIGFGCNSVGHSFSNIVIKALGSAEEVRYTYDGSSDSTKRNSYVIDLVPLAANGFIFEFHTTDEICLSNLIIWKSIDVNARISGIRPDGLTGDVSVTIDNNLRVTDAESGLAIAKGDVSSTTFIHKFGAAPDFDIVDGFVTVWDGAEDGEPYESMRYNYSVTNNITTISAENNGDTQPVEIQGLDINYNLVVQTVTLAGNTQVPLTTPLIRIFRMKNIGSVDFAGHVFCYISGATVTAGVPTNGTQIRAVIHSTNNQTEMAVFTIPSGYTGYMRDWYASTAGAKRDSSHTIKVLARPFGQVFQLKHTSNIDVSGTSYIQHTYVEPERFLEKTDVEIRMNTDQNEAGVSAGFDIVLVKNLI